MSEPDERQRQNIELARRGLDAFAQGDLETVLTVISEEVEVLSSPELMNAGAHRGHDGFLDWTEEWVDAWEGLDLRQTALAASFSAFSPTLSPRLSWSALGRRRRLGLLPADALGG